MVPPDPGGVASVTQRGARSQQDCTGAWVREARPADGERALRHRKLRLRRLQWTQSSGSYWTACDACLAVDGLTSPAPVGPRLR